MQLKRLTLSVMMMGASAAVMASGYHFGTQSVSSQSTANASAAEAADASTIFYNAAGMTKLEGNNFSGAINLVMPSVEYSNAQGRTPANSSTGYSGATINGATSGKITDDLVAVPHLYLTHQLGQNLFAGLGVYVPYASSTEYQKNSVLRYNVNETELKTIDINPTMALKLNEQHSFAAGVIAQYAKASLRQYANFAQTLAGAYGNLAVAAVAAGNLALAGQYQGLASARLGKDGEGTYDGYAVVKGDDWGYGFNLAWLWDISDNARVGLNYRSAIKHTLSGTADWTTPSGTDGTILAKLGYVDSGASVDIKTPESLSLHGMYQLNPKLNIFGDVTWTKHSEFDTVQINYDTAKQVLPASVAGKTSVTILQPKWKDTYKIAFGGSYNHTDQLQLRAGVAYDKSPVSSADYRLTTMPDNDRIWLSLGGNYKASKKSSIDLAYSYIFIKDATANVNGYCGGASAKQVNCVSSYTSGSASFKSHAQILGVQYNYKF